MRAVGIDPAWGGTGAAVIDERGQPIVVRHRVFPRKDQERIVALVDFLDGLQAEVGPEPALWAIERPPPVYRRGNQAETALGMGRLIGGIMMWLGLRRPADDVRLIPVEDWRDPGAARGRDGWKRWAVATAFALGPGVAWERFDWDSYEGPRADVSEAFLIARYAQRAQRILGITK